MEQKIIKIADLEVNRGQIDGLPKNPRTIKDERFEALKKSIEDAPEMLNLRELLVYPHNGKYVIIGGNMRLKACKDLGYKELPCKVIDENTPVEKLREYTIKDNIGFGADDWGALFEDWNTDELADWGLEFPEDINVDETQETEIVEDEVPEEVETKCKRGDLWQLGEHRLFCGDATIMDDAEKLMGGGGQIDMLLTDPPYNQNYEGGTKEKLTIKNDSMSDTAFRQFLLDAFIVADAYMKAGAVFYIWHADAEVFNFRFACREVGWKVRECLIWNKNAMVLGRQDYQYKHEPCLYGWKDGASHSWYSDRKQTTILDFNKPLRNGEHPTMKPLDLIGYQIKNSSKKGDVILDLFGGSGSTLIACEQLNRKCFMMELDEHYCDVIIARWEKLTGKTAVKINE